MPKATDTVLGHCLLRAMAAAEGGIAEINARVAAGERYSKFGALRLSVRVSPKAMRVATFIVCWAIGMKADGVEEYSITEYQRFWKENERQTYRVQNEFRDLWPEFKTPNELAVQLVKQVDARIAKKDAAKLPITLRMTADARA
jgi:hypothetical protein